MKNSVFLITVSLVLLTSVSAYSQKKVSTCGQALKLNINNCLLNSSIDKNSWQDCIQYGMDSHGFVYNDDYYIVGEKNFQCFDNNAPVRDFGANVSPPINSN